MSINSQNNFWECRSREKRNRNWKALHITRYWHIWATTYVNILVSYCSPINNFHFYFVLSLVYLTVFKQNVRRVFYNRMWVTEFVHKCDFIKTENVARFAMIQSIELDNNFFLCVCLPKLTDHIIKLFARVTSIK